MRLRLARLPLLISIGAALCGAFAYGAAAHSSAGAPIAIPANQPDKGLVYDGLDAATQLCGFFLKVRGEHLCSHGPDAPPRGYAVANDVAPAVTTAATPGILCDGDGVSGKRVQVMYLRASDQPDRFATYLDSIRSWAAGADTIFNASAAETGGYRRIRFVTDPACDLSVLNVVVSPTGDDSFSSMTSELSALGYGRSDRKYLVFADANVYCGIGSMWLDDSAGAANLNNQNTSYARVDAGCWGGATAAHELMHNLGGVQNTAPNSSLGGHCTDEWDRMCYSDSPNYPAMRTLCTDTNHDNRFDCNHDDYYNTAPAPGSYLATHWDTTNSGWLITAPPAPLNWAAQDSTDFDGDRITDLGSLYEGRSPLDALWFAPATAGGSAFQIYFGDSTDVPVPGDYDGDGRTDAVIYRPGTGLWYGPRTGFASIVIQLTLGQAGDIPVPGDYDGDGKTDPAIYRPSAGMFFALLSGGGTKTATFGGPNDVPVPRDYDGDGKTDFGIYRANVSAGLGLWYAPLSGGGVYQIYFGGTGDVPVPGDYNGDKRAEAVIFRPSTGLWYGPYNGAAGLFQLMLGQSGDVPIPGYYDNDLSEDPAIFRPSTGLWFSALSGGGVARVDGLGTAADVAAQKRPTLAGGT